jgi:hypothetical protein
VPISQPLETLKTEWPKLVASGIIIPVIQWFAGFAWQLRRRVRAAALRKEIIAVEDFIAKHRATVAFEDEAIIVSNKELARLLQELHNTSVPLAVSHPRIMSVAHFFLLYPPKYPVSWITRIVFFIGVANFLFTIYRARVNFWNERNLISTTSLLLGFFLYSWLTRRADSATGPIVKRALWKRATLLYPPVSIAAGFCQLLFWVFITLSVVAFSDEDNDISDYLLTALIVIPFAALLWYLSFHLDRSKTRTESAAAASTAG